MRKLILCLFLSILIAPVSGYASIYGTLKGKVLNADEGNKGLKNARVAIGGTTKGTIIKSDDGSFTITGITAGSYKVKVTYTGMETKEVDVTIVADQTSTIDVVMSSKSFKTEELIITGSKTKKNATDIGQITNMGQDELRNTPRSSLAAVIATAAGVSNQGTGFSIRGSQSSETQIRVDGMEVSNQFTGGFGQAGSAYTPMVSTYGVEQVQVLKGGFSAEYGEAQAGYVNSVGRVGRTDKYSSYFAWRTDIPSLWGSQKAGIRVIKEGNKYKPQEYGPGLKLQGGQENEFDFGIGGPLQIYDNATFFISTNMFTEKYRSNSYEVKDPWGNNIGLMDGNRSWKKNISAKFQLPIYEGLMLTLSTSYGITSLESSSWDMLYSTETGKFINKQNPLDTISNGIAENIAKQNVFNNNVYNVLARITHAINPESFYEINFSTNVNNEELSRRIGNDDPNFFTGFDIYEPKDEYSFDGNDLVKGSPDKIIDIYQSLIEIRKSEDGFFEGTFNKRNPLTGYYEGEPNYTGSNNPYGLSRYFQTSGSDGGFSFRYGSYYQVDGSYTLSFKHGSDKQSFDHTFKAGFEARFFEQHRHANSNPWDGNPFYDVYSDKWGGNLYADDAKVYSKTSSPFKPRKYGFYLTDQIVYKGIIFTPGLRLDIFDPNSNYRLPSQNFTSIKSDSGFAAAKAKVQVSPRINISYPITEVSTLRLSYGWYFKVPQLQNLYDKYPIDLIRPGDIVGNPNMDAQKTAAYEISYDHVLSQDYLFTVSSYYKDAYNQLGIKQYQAVPSPYFQYEVSEYGSSKGIEFEFKKTQRDNFGFSINYTLANAEGTSSSPSSNYNPAIDIYTGRPQFPLATYPQPWDIRHVLKTNLVLFWQKNEGPSIGNVFPLENTVISLESNFSSGAPYTKVDKDGKRVSDINAERGPSGWSMSSRISKTFMLKDFFGESVGNTTVEFFADIYNVLNQTDATGYYIITGDPDDDGRSLEKRIGDFVATPFYKNATIENTSSYSPDQYDSYGKRLYSEYADYDKNGIVTQQEKFESYIKYVETNMKFRSNYRTPITIFGGIAIRFN